MAGRQKNEMVRMNAKFDYIFINFLYYIYDNRKYINDYILQLIQHHF